MNPLPIAANPKGRCRKNVLFIINDSGAKFERARTPLATPNASANANGLKRIKSKSRQFARGA